MCTPLSPHTGRGGWTWYTGSAGWMYRLITESLLGLRLDVDKLRFAPCLPSSWASFKIHYRYRETVYHITFRKLGTGSTVKRILLDGNEQPENHIPLTDDRHEHMRRSNSVEFGFGIYPYILENSLQVTGLILPALPA